MTTFERCQLNLSITNALWQREVRHIGSQAYKQSLKGTGAIKRVETLTAEIYKFIMPPTTRQVKYHGPFGKGAGRNFGG